MSYAVTFTNPAGDVLDFTDEDAGYRVVAAGTRGLRSPTYRIAAQRFANTDGETLQTIAAEASSPVLGLLVRADSWDALEDRTRALVRHTRPKAGDGTLTVARPDGTRRMLACRVIDGLPGAEDSSERAPGRWWRVLLKFYAPDPWWRGDEVTATFGLAAPSVFLSPTLPFPRILSASTIQGAQSIDLSMTDAEAFPVFTVVGPGTSLTLTNTTTGKVLTLNAAIADGAAVVIDTRPGEQSIRAATLPPAVLTEQRRNRVPNPTVASSTSWFATAGTGGTVTTSQPATGGPDNGPFYRATYTVANTTGVGASSAAAITADGRASAALPIPVTPGLVYSAAIYARSSIAQLLDGRLQWYDAAGTALTTDLAASSVVTPGVWTRYTMTGTAPPTAAYARVAVGTPAGTGAVPFPIGATLDATYAQLEQTGTLGDYFDGTTAGLGDGSRHGDVVYTWSGAAHMTPSIQWIASSSGDPVLGASLMGSLATDPALWSLVEDVNAVTVVLGSAGVNSRVIVEYEPRYAGI